MASAYRTIPPVGQTDQYACWAACLTWWLKALQDGRPSWSQMQIIAEYDKYCDDSGGFPPEKLLDVWPKDNRLKISGGVFPTAAYRTGRLPLGEKPVMIGFNYPTIGGSHMNVLFDYSSQMNARNLTAMEPYFPYPGQDGRRTGAMMDRTVDFYIKDSRNIILFWPTVTFSG